jgi:sugar lactone lactonase YvrE
MLKSLYASVLLVALAAPAAAQSAAPPDSDKPTNDLPNPYRSAKSWGKLPNGRAWGAVSAVAIDNDGKSVWVADRCGPNPNTPANVSSFMWDSCSNSDAPPIHKFDSAGNLLISFGAKMFVFPHEIRGSRDGNLWVIDNRGPNARELKENPASANRGHAVYKFSPEGKLLMTIGTPGKAGNPPDALNEPNSIAEDSNGEIYIAEGHQGQAPNSPPDTVARISRFSAEGKYIGSFGKFGAGPGEFRVPHNILFDAEGRLVVADRGNMRIQILERDGKYIGEMKQFSRPSAMVLKGDTFYVADSESNGTYPHPGWERGIRVGTYSTGVVVFRIPDADNLKGTSSAEGIAVDAAGAIYAAEVGARQMVKHVRPE